MRTTLTLDPDVARMVADEAHRARKPVKQVVNEALRRGLSGAPTKVPSKPYRVRPHTGGLRPGFDDAHLNALADELEDEAILAPRTRRR